MPHKLPVSASVFTVQRENIRSSLLLRTRSSSRLLLAVFFVLDRGWSLYGCAWGALISLRYDKHAGIIAGWFDFRGGQNKCLQLCSLHAYRLTIAPNEINAAHQFTCCHRASAFCIVVRITDLFTYNSFDEKPRQSVEAWLLSPINYGTRGQTCAAKIKLPSTRTDRGRPRLFVSKKRLLISCIMQQYYLIIEKCQRRETIVIHTINC